MFSEKPRHVMLSDRVIDACEHIGYDISKSFPPGEDIQPIAYHDLFKDYGHILAERLSWNVLASTITRRDIVYGTYLAKAGHLNPMTVLHWTSSYLGPRAPELALTLYKDVKSRLKLNTDVFMRTLLELISYSGDKISRGYVAAQLWQMHEDTLGEWFCTIQAAWREDLTPREIRQLDLPFPYPPVEKQYDDDEPINRELLAAAREAGLA